MKFFLNIIPKDLLAIKDIDTIDTEIEKSTINWYRIGLV